MFTSANLRAATLALAFGGMAAGALAADRVVFEGVGRPATAAEIAAWDIDVRPDFAGLPPGSGSVADGESIWLAKCASCHGDFGDSNQVFTPIALGNVTEADIASGRVASLNDPTRTRTTLMKVATLSTLFDYINRAMPWNAPKSLHIDEVYALVAWMLSLEYVVEPDFVLSDRNVAEVQARMPNRNGMTMTHGMWSVRGKPDVQGDRCARDCTVDTTVSSAIPAFAMNAHGNLRDQMRIFGPYPGIDTGGDTAPAPQAAAPSGPLATLETSGCLACHDVTGQRIGPPFAEVMKKYAGRADAADYLAGKIRNGGSGVWGGAMPPMPQLSDETIVLIAAWLAGEQSKQPEGNTP